MDPFRNVTLAAVLMLAVASCADAQRTASPPTVTDSAGIRIVGNEWPTNTAATLASSPTLEIGSGADPAGQLSGVVAALRLGDGRIAIAEQSTRSVKIFDTRGQFVRALGRQGAGPGEFAAITRLQRLPGDSIAAYDGLRATLAVFDTTGRLARTNRLVSGMGGLQLVGLMSNGTMILTRAYNPMFSRTSRLERDSIIYVAAQAGSATLDTILVVPGSEVFLFAGADFSSRNPIPFGRISLIGVQDDRLAIATGDGWQVEMRGPTGELREIHRVRREAVAVTKDDIARYKRDELDRMRGTRVQAAGGGGAPSDMQARMVEQRRRMLEAVPYPTTHAPYDSLLIGDAGEVWVRSAETPAGRPRRWIVLSRDGAALGAVSVPRGLRLLEVGNDFVVAVRRDDDDVEHVGIYQLRRERGSETR
jgi:hypothetical protein